MGGGFSETGGVCKNMYSGREVGWTPLDRKRQTTGEFIAGRKISREDVEYEIMAGS